ncbi:MAG: transcriptional regulator [Candidatus Omnitrophica bacterium CG11_big_fil_rev_8_21_14_0_20_45_26]|uniref:Transcriptional regulator n=1 Tax=Candidatus Abzuiibacterium crystallinum TaxID=1974748 RepID=A0A2H0LMZ3_9BACT|nr:MAG: transcriptional regulator [Candidatus Omnitrophica bacterium CG11_big_fil_rev_8_21_14_0_20_45_26]PIW63879.1 MAG: transcriptional regulator [Candidatus Omnitrophica bacterium CG12_big_fil_rev_8_21_14_0_65_45_16]
MKKVECIIQPKKFPELETALRRIGITGMTVSEVKGFGKEQTRPDSYLFLPKTKVEIFCSNEDVEFIIDVIVQVCQTGKLGDGKIVVTDLHEVIRIRTRERGVIAV